MKNSSCIVHDLFMFDWHGETVSNTSINFQRSPSMGDYHKEVSMKAVVYLAILTAPLLYMVGCQSLPSASRSGEMKEIVIGENLSPAELRVNTGDEVRWTNKHMVPVRIEFLEPVEGKLSCHNNFGGVMTGRNAATLGPNESASLCFREPVDSTYVVRPIASRYSTMGSHMSDKKIALAGTIRVDGIVGRASVQELPAIKFTDTKTGGGSICNQLC
jgi:plastocyanin